MKEGERVTERQGEREVWGERRGWREEERPAEKERKKKTPHYSLITSGQHSYRSLPQ